MDILERTELQVATFNIHHGEGLDGAIDLTRTARVIADTGARVIGLQEVDRHLERSAGVDQVEALANLTGLHVAFHPTIQNAGGEYGIAIAADEPVATSFFGLPLIGGEEPRGVIVGRALGANFLVTHLSQDARARALQTRTLVDLSASLEDPVVLMGDLNQDRGDLGPLERAGFAFGARIPTMARWWRRSQLDHIGVRGAAFLESWTLPSRASDHLPLVAMLAPQGGA